MPEMPFWLQWILGASALVGAIGVIWTKFVRPLGALITYMHQMLPLLATLTEHFKNDPDYLEVLSEIAAQFKTNSGTTLRDIVNELLASAKENKEAAKDLRIKAGLIEEKVAVVKQLASTDRAESVKEDSKRLAILNELLDKIKGFEAAFAAHMAAGTLPQPQKSSPPPLPSVGGTNVVAVVEAHEP